MALLGKAILAVWNETLPEDEQDFNDWYLREHIPERTSVPGMVRGRRYESLDSAPKNMALYEALTLDVLTSGAYRTQLANPTPWTKRIGTKFSFMRRGICDVIAAAGEGVGGYATALHFSPSDPAAARAWVETIVPELVGMTQICGAHCWVAAAGETPTPTSALSQRATVHGPVAWVLAIEAADLGALEAAKAAVLAREAPAVLTAYPNYRLLYVLER